jgi:hypothetical protein
VQEKRHTLQNVEGLASSWFSSVVDTRLSSVETTHLTTSCARNLEMNDISPRSVRESVEEEDLENDS